MLNIDIGIVADWLVTYAGSEKVIKEFIEIFPCAELYSVVDFLSDEDRELFKGKKAKNDIYSEASNGEKEVSKIFTLDANGS